MIPGLICPSSYGTLPVEGRPPTAETELSAEHFGLVSFLKHML